MAVHILEIDFKDKSNDIWFMFTNCTPSEIIQVLQGTISKQFGHRNLSVLF